MSQAASQPEDAPRQGPATGSDTGAGNHEGGMAPKQQTLLKSSMLMASGTLVSRILGFVRSALLVAVLGVGAGAAASFGVANTLPNMVYNLLAAGIIDAILIPQIVRALKGRAGSQYVNKLLTAAGTLLFLLTVLSMIAIPVIVTILAPGFSPEMRSLTITFAIICVPQIFFYGIYNLLGELLNARGIFGPYMWAPVINNVVGIASLALFLYLWGPSGDIRAASSMTSAQIAVVAGMATVGVIAQALWLLIPLRGSGLKLRLDFQFRGTDFGSASKVAWWTFATLLVSQVGVISTSRIATFADSWSDSSGEVVAGIAAYNYAFMLYMVPQSLVAVTLATAIFTRLANDVSDGNMEGVAFNFHRGVELIMLLSFYVAAVLAVTATSVMQMIMPTFGPAAASMYGNVLVALIFALPSTGMVLMSQRVFFALEDARPVFLMGIFPTILQVAVGWTIYFTMSAQWWTIGASAGETVCRVVQGFIGIVWVGRVVRQVNVGRLISRYVRYMLLFVVAALVGALILHLLGGASVSATGLGRFFDSAWRVTVTAAVISVVYFGLLSFIDPSGARGVFGPLADRVRPRPASGSVLPPGLEVDSGQQAEDVLSAEAADSRTTPATATSADDGARLGSGQVHHAVQPSAWAQEPPRWDDILPGQAAGTTLSRSLSTVDLASTGAIPALSGPIPIIGGGAREALAACGSPRANADLSAASHVPPQPHRPAPPPPADQQAGGDGQEGADDALYARLDTATSADEGNVDAIDVEREPDVSGNSPSGSNTGRAAEDDDKRFNPTIPALVLGLVVVVVAGAIAFRNLLPPNVGDLLAEVTTVVPQSAQSAEPEEVVEAEEEVLPSAPPVISGATIYSWDNDDGDHPELAAALLDGDPDSVWRSRYFTVNEFAEGNQIAILLSLAEPAVVSEITLNVIGQGGEVVVRNSSGGDPRQGDVLATAPITPDTVIGLPQPTEMSAIGLVFNTLPTDDEGMYRAKITGISVR